MDAEKLDEKDTEHLAELLMTQQQREKFENLNEIDLAYTSPELSGRFRANIFRQKGCIEIIIRLIPAKIPTIEDLKLPSVLKNIALIQRGFILLTGAVGSGKSTTVAAIINYMNKETASHIITIEDPMEFVFEDAKSSVTQRELGIDTDSYHSALKYSLRQDPDVIFVGEMRDTETVATALSAAETGHLVLSTLHTVDASQTIDRIIDFFPSTQQNQIRSQFSNTLAAVISLRLVERSDKKGRVPAVEVMLATQTIKTLIKEGKTSQIRSNIQAGTSQYGMQTFDQSLVELYKNGLISMDNALAEATSPNDVKLAITGIMSSVVSAQEQLKNF